VRSIWAQIKRHRSEVAATGRPRIT
jgi:hypothetical protein